MDELKFEIRILKEGDEIPSPQKVSAVFLIALEGDNLVAIRNHRGWDLPAGHLEEGESVLEALQREVMEEASMTFTKVIPIVLVVSNSTDPKYKEKCMIGFASNEFTLKEFMPAPDSQERKIMSIGQFLSLYKQNKESMRLMIDSAREVLT